MKGKKKRDNRYKGVLLELFEIHVLIATNIMMWFLHLLNKLMFKPKHNRCLLAIRFAKNFNNCVVRY